MSKKKDLRSARNKRSGKYEQRRSITEKNRKRKWKKHLKEHPNHIKGMEHIRQALGIN